MILKTVFRSWNLAQEDYVKIVWEGKKTGLKVTTKSTSLNVKNLILGLRMAFLRLRKYLFEARLSSSKVRGVEIKRLKIPRKRLKLAAFKKKTLDEIYGIKQY